MEEMTDEQQGAITELRQIEAASQGSLEILGIVEPAAAGKWLGIKISVSCEGFERREHGFKLRDRERFLLYVPPNYPYAPPSTFAPGHRFAFHEHVTWIGRGVNICVYYSSDQQWQPELRMAGFVDRLLGLLERAARGEADAIGAPIHPPVINEGEVEEFFVAQVDAPTINGVWLGYAELDQKSDRRFDITGWRKHPGAQRDKLLAPTVLIDSPFVSELPEFVSNLIAFFDRRGVQKGHLADLLIAHALYDPTSRPLYIIFGTAMRGTVGEGDRRQHLVVWRIKQAVANRLRKLAKQHKKLTPRRINKILRSGADTIDEWARNSDRLAWCRVMDQRPEVTTRRDHASGAHWFHGKSVTVWGCGALGSAAAEYLVRAGVRKLTVVDKGIVTPGLLVRQNFTDADVGTAKARALVNRLALINPQVQPVSRVADLLNTACDMAGDLTDADVLIDATASKLVALKLEKERRDGRIPSLPVVSIGIDAGAERSVMTVSPPTYSGGPADLMRKCRIQMASAGGMVAAVSAFWPEQEEDWFEPEPGCSSPTFVGSAADVAALTGGMTGLAGDVLREGRDEGSVHFGLRGGVRFHQREGEEPRTFWFPPDLRIHCPETGYEIRVSQEARDAMDEAIGISASTSGPTIETGGVLFGERNDFLKIVWVTEASGPPTDSKATASEFVCGIEGVAETHTRKVRETGGTVAFIGMWHTHPGAEPAPSVTDMGTMQRLVSGPDAVARRMLLVIVGYSAGSPEVAGRIYLAEAAPM